MLGFRRLPACAGWIQRAGLLALAAALVACVGYQPGPRAQLGALGGAAAGGLIGSAASDGAGDAIAAGVLLGGLLGGAVGDSLDRNEAWHSPSGSCRSGDPRDCRDRDGYEEGYWDGYWRENRSDRRW